MPSTFAITISTTKVVGRGEVSYTVTNTGATPIRGRADLLTAAPDNAKPPHAELMGSPYRDFLVNGTQQFTVKIDSPAGAPAGTHTARLRMVDDEHPEEVSEDGPAFTYEITPPPPRQGLPRWVIPVALVVALLVVGGGGVIS